MNQFFSLKAKINKISHQLQNKKLLVMSKSKVKIQNMLLFCASSSVSFEKE